MFWRYDACYTGVYIMLWYLRYRTVRRSSQNRAEWLGPLRFPLCWSAAALVLKNRTTFLHVKSSAYMRERGDTCRYTYQWCSAYFLFIIKFPLTRNHRYSFYVFHILGIFIAVRLIALTTYLFRLPTLERHDIMTKVSIFILDILCLYTLILTPRTWEIWN